MTLKIRSRSTKSNHIFAYIQQCIYASLVKIHQLVQQKSMETLFWTFQSARMTLKIRSSSSKSNQLIPLPTMYLCKFGQNPSAGSAEKHGNPILDISKCQDDLGKLGQAHQNLINSSPLPTMYPCKFGQNPSTGSEDNAQKRSGRQRRRDQHQKQYVPHPSGWGDIKMA